MTFTLKKHIMIEKCVSQNVDIMERLKSLDFKQKRNPGKSSLMNSKVTLIDL